MAGTMGPHPLYADENGEALDDEEPDIYDAVRERQDRFTAIVKPDGTYRRDGEVVEEMDLNDKSRVAVNLDIELTAGMDEMICRMLESGLFGSNMQEVVERCICDTLIKLCTEGWFDE